MPSRPQGRGFHRHVASGMPDLHDALETHKSADVLEATAAWKSGKSWAFGRGACPPGRPKSRRFSTEPDCGQDEWNRNRRRRADLNTREVASALDELGGAIRACTRCPLHASRTHAVPARENRARVMLVGEAPGEEEDRIGRPFIGRAGRFLDCLLDEIGVRRPEIFITSSVKCRPPRTARRARLSSRPARRPGSTARSS
jgi:hypothetical protein